MLITINQVEYDIRKGSKLKLNDGRIVYLTSKDPWNSVSGTKMIVIHEGEETTIKESDIAEVIQVEHPNTSSSKMSRLAETIKNMSVTNKIPTETINELKALHVNDVDDTDDIDDDMESEENESLIALQQQMEEDNYSEVPVTRKFNKEVPKATAIKEQKVNGIIKPKFSLIPQLALEEVAKVMTYGEQSKYGKYNFSKGENASTYVDAALRHINKYLRNQNIDSETKTHHLANAIADLMMSLDNILNGTSTDDRDPNYKN